MRCAYPGYALRAAPQSRSPGKAVGRPRDADLMSPRARLPRRRAPLLCCRKCKGDASCEVSPGCAALIRATHFERRRKVVARARPQAAPGTQTARGLERDLRGAVRLCCASDSARSMRRVRSAPDALRVWTGDIGNTRSETWVTPQARSLGETHALEREEPNVSSKRVRSVGTGARSQCQ